MVLHNRQRSVNSHSMMKTNSLEFRLGNNLCVALWPKHKESPHRTQRQKGSCVDCRPSPKVAFCLTDGTFPGYGLYFRKIDVGLNIIAQLCTICDIDHPLQVNLQRQISCNLRRHYWKSILTLLCTHVIWLFLRNDKVTEGIDLNNISIKQNGIAQNTIYHAI